ncbi:MAG: helix-turn-helix domain-containing protein [Saccharofermentans sp.]|nr:helix-turn-helix domain-containing protein [Saccharofermentans sp.]
MKDDFEKFLDKQLQNEEFRKEWESLEPEYAIMKALIEARTSQGLTQKELSIRSGIAQGDISKIENGNANPSIKTLKRLATAMGKSLKIEFTDPESGNVRPAS